VKTKIQVRIQGVRIERFRVERTGGLYVVTILDPEFGRFCLGDCKIEILPEHGTEWVEVTDQQLAELFMKQ